MESKTAIKVIDGKLIQGVKIIAPEIGNPEHIKALKDYENRLTEQLKIAKGKGLRVSVEAREITYTQFVSFECVCGKEIEEGIGRIDADSPDELTDINIDVEDENFTCPKCGREYTIKNGRAMLIE